MLKIKDVVDGVVTHQREYGLSERTIQQRIWSVYTPIVNYHYSNGTEYYSKQLTRQLCELYRERYENKEISRKYYRAFVTAEYRMNSFVETGKVDFSLIKEQFRYTPSAEYLTLTEDILNCSNLSKTYCSKLSPDIRHFFLFYENRKASINQISNEDFFDYFSEISKDRNRNMVIATRALKQIASYINTNNIAHVTANLEIFRPQRASRQIIERYTQEEISAILAAISDKTSKTPKRDRAMILLAFNSGIRGADVRNIKLTDIDWKSGEINIVQKKTSTPLSASLNGKTLNAIADYILNERPKSSCESIFLKYGPPYTALKTTASLDCAIDKYCKLAGVAKKEKRAFHSLRRSYAVELAEAEVSLTTISQLLGHQDFSSDKVYLSFNRTQTYLCSLDFADVPINNGIYAKAFSLSRIKTKKDGDRK